MIIFLDTKNVTRLTALNKDGAIQKLFPARATFRTYLWSVCIVIMMQGFFSKHLPAGAFFALYPSLAKFYISLFHVNPCCAPLPARTIRYLCIN